MRRNIKPLVIFFVPAFLLFGCKNNTNENHYSDTSPSSDSSQSTPSSDFQDSESSSAIIDTNTTIDTNTGPPSAVETIFCHNQLITGVHADGDSVYIMTAYSMFKGSSQPDSFQTSHPLPWGISSQNIVFNDSNIFWFENENEIAAVSKSTDTVTTLSLPGAWNTAPSLLLLPQKQRLVAADLGCENILRINLDGSNPISSSKPTSGDLYGFSPTAANSNQIYCGGGGGGSTNGKLYQSPIDGGEIEEVATVTIPDHVMVFQFAGMVATDSSLYYIENSAAGAWKHRLVSVSLDTFEQTILVDKDELGGNRLLTDDNQNILYWLSTSGRKIYKYNIETNALTEKDIPLDYSVVRYGLGMNSSYFFIPTAEDCVARMDKF